MKTEKRIVLAHIIREIRNNLAHLEVRRTPDEMVPLYEEFFQVIKSNYPEFFGFDTFADMCIAVGELSVHDLGLLNNFGLKLSLMSTLQMTTFKREELVDRFFFGVPTETPEEERRNEAKTAAGALAHWLIPSLFSKKEVKEVPKKDTSRCSTDVLDSAGNSVTVEELEAAIRVANMQNVLVKETHPSSSRLFGKLHSRRNTVLSPLPLDSRELLRESISKESVTQVVEAILRFKKRKKEVPTLDDVDERVKFEKKAKGKTFTIDNLAEVHGFLEFNSATGEVVCFTPLMSGLEQTSMAPQNRRIAIGIACLLDTRISMLVKLKNVKGDYQWFPALLESVSLIEELTWRLFDQADVENPMRIFTREKVKALEPFKLPKVLKEKLQSSKIPLGGVHLGLVKDPRKYFTAFPENFDGLLRQHFDALLIYARQSPRGPQRLYKEGPDLDTDAFLKMLLDGEGPDPLLSLKFVFLEDKGGVEKRVVYEFSVVDGKVQKKYSNTLPTLHAKGTTPRDPRPKTYERFISPNSFHMLQVTGEELPSGVESVLAKSVLSASLAGVESVKHEKKSQIQKGVHFNLELNNMAFKPHAGKEAVQFDEPKSFRECQTPEQVMHILQSMKLQSVQLPNWVRFTTLVLSTFMAEIAKVTGALHRLPSCASITLTSPGPVFKNTFVERSTGIIATDALGDVIPVLDAPEDEDLEGLGEQLKDMFRPHEYTYNRDAVDVAKFLEDFGCKASKLDSIAATTKKVLASLPTWEKMKYLEQCSGKVSDARTLLTLVMMLSRNTDFATVKGWFQSAGYPLTESWESVFIEETVEVFRKKPDLGSRLKTVFVEKRDDDGDEEFVVWRTKFSTFDQQLFVLFFVLHDLPGVAFSFFQSPFVKRLLHHSKCQSDRSNHGQNCRKWGGPNGVLQKAKNWLKSAGEALPVKGKGKKKEEFDEDDPDSSREVVTEAWRLVVTRTYGEEAKAFGTFLREFHGMHIC